MGAVNPGQAGESVEVEEASQAGSLARRQRAAASERWPLVIVGAGAAGLMAAIHAGRSGVRTLLLETRPRPGAKIRVSGGGRCNVLPSRVELDDYATSGSRHTLRNILLSWPLAEVREFFERDLGVPLVTEPGGKVFPRSSQSRDVLEALLAAATRAGVELRAGSAVVDVAQATVVETGASEGTAGHAADEFDRAGTSGAAREFVVRRADGALVSAARVILATGGLSLPKTGSDGGGLRLARALGHRLLPDYPALVPLTTSEHAWTSLTGVSAQVELRVVAGTRVLETRRGDILFTHRGFSGPVVLDVSRHLAAPRGPGLGIAAGEARPALRARFAPDLDWAAILSRPGPGLVATRLREGLPRRLGDILLERAGVPAERRVAELTRAERQRLCALLEGAELSVDGDEGYRTAEVTGGGVALDLIVPASLESRILPGLHFAGEILDVVGRLGGYNFLWAWVSGRVAGRGAAAGLVAPPG